MGPVPESAWAKARAPPPPPMIIISGAGPVGLSCAYFIKKKYPREHVVIVEKRAAYSRKQVLLIRPDVVALLPKIGDACFVFPPPVNHARCYPNATNLELKSISVTNLQTTLDRECRSIGVEFVQEDILKYDGVQKAKFVIACDGYNSPIANHFLQVRRNKLTQTCYGLIVLLTPGSNRRYFATIKPKMRKRGSQNRFRAFRTIHGDFYIGISISKQTFDDVNATHVDQVVDVPVVRDAIKSAKIYYGMEDCKVNTVKAFEIPVTVSHPLFKITNSTTFYLCGDAVFGAHFFSGEGVNSGIRAAHFLSKNLFDTNLHSMYTTWYQNEIEQKLSNYKNIIIDFENLELRDRKTLEKIAQKHDIRHSGISTYDLNVMLHQKYTGIRHTVDRLLNHVNTS
tara:strand:- start:1432 stop:2622 length:1191 start_codon:yes stop_codon:yes gene_type:complete